MHLLVPTALSTQAHVEIEVLYVLDVAEKGSHQILNSQMSKGFLISGETLENKVCRVGGNNLLKNFTGVFLLLLSCLYFEYLMVGGC